MGYTLFIDESGNINKNNHQRYFVIAGYLVESHYVNHKYKMMKILKNVNKKYNDYFKYDSIQNNKTEVKFSNLNIDGKNYVYNKLNELEGQFVAIVVDKYECTDLTEHKYNDYYNYLLSLLIKYIFDVRKFDDPTKLKELNVIYDNRSMKIAANNDLQAYLLTKFKISRKYNKYSCNFNVQEADSKVNYGVMISDFVAGLCWATYNYGPQKYGQGFNINYLSKFPYKDFGKEIKEVACTEESSSDMNQ